MKNGKPGQGDYLTQSHTLKVYEATCLHMLTTEVAAAVLGSILLWDPKSATINCDTLGKLLNISGFSFLVKEEIE